RSINDEGCCSHCFGIITTGNVGSVAARRSCWFCDGQISLASRILVGAENSAIYSKGIKNMSMFQEAIAEKIWDAKYRYRYRGEIVDQTIEDTWLRVSQAIAAAENVKNIDHWQQKFYEVLQGFRFLPGGRILAGAGTKHAVTLLNCFVMPI